jgi:purine-binding chemotaxis protein CheW
MGRKYVSFVVGEGHYAIPLDEVYQIIRYENPTEVPSAPPFVEGVINLAGEVVPVVDLRRRFAVSNGAATRRSRVIVTEREGRRYGLLVDAVREILELEETNVSREATAVFGLKAEFVLGIAKIHEDLLVLLDIFRILAANPDVPFREPAS